MSDDETSSKGGETWVEWFCGLKGHEFFCEVDRRYIEDKFNLYGLRAIIPNYLECLSLILDKTDDDTEPETLQNAIDLYGLIHARYIITSRGLDAMLRKYQSEAFGTCPNVQCHNQLIVPVGTHDDLRFDQVKVYCPKCQNIYRVQPQDGVEELDGAYFGTTFAHLFFLTHPHLIPPSRPKQYVPRVFGYRIHNVGPSRKAKNDSYTKEVEGLMAEIAKLKSRLVIYESGPGAGGPRHEHMVMADAAENADKECGDTADAGADAMVVADDVQSRLKKKRTESFN